MVKVGFSIHQDKISNNFYSTGSACNFSKSDLYTHFLGLGEAWILDQYVGFEKHIQRFKACLTLWRNCAFVLQNMEVFEDERWHLEVRDFWLSTSPLPPGFQLETKTLTSSSDSSPFEHLSCLSSLWIGNYHSFPFARRFDHMAMPNQCVPKISGAVFPVLLVPWTRTQLWIKSGYLSCF